MTLNRQAADLPREQWHSWDPMLLSGKIYISHKFNKPLYKIIIHERVGRYDTRLNVHRMSRQSTHLYIDTLKICVSDMCLLY